MTDRPEWLVITLAAPMASFGEAPGNVQRGTADYPTRSALLGLAGAALGIRRADTNGQRALFMSFRVATRTLRSGTWMVDFHTYQSLPSTQGQVRTRADALARRQHLNTSITQREYRADVLYEAAYRATVRAAYTLEEVRAAFERPAYTLYLGRKSCPLSSPLAPKIVQGRTVVEAFTRYHTTPIRFRNTVVAVEDRQDLGHPDATLRVRLRMDDPVDRSTWHFSPRREYAYVPPRDDHAQETGEKASE